jgi:very-short-patch-repair endonuclease
MQKELDRLKIKYLTHQVINNKWVVDILLVDYSIVIECDGDYWHSLPGAILRDSLKNIDLHNLGYRVIRLKGSQISHSLEKCSKLIEDIVRTAGQLADVSRNVIHTIEK